MEDERVSRLEREAQTLKRVGEDIYRLQERIEQEKAQREGSLHSLQSEINEIAGGRNLSDEKFQVMSLYSFPLAALGPPDRLSFPPGSHFGRDCYDEKQVAT